MDKTRIFKLKPGATVKFGSTYLGYTRGISIKYEKKLHFQTNQRWDGIVGAKIIDIGATIKVGVMEYDTVKDILINETLSFGKLEVSGQTFAGTDRKFTFNNAFREDVDEFTLSRSDATIFMITFRAILDSDGNLGTYE